MTAYYNEFDPKAAAWLRQLIKDGLIAPGDVDERSITDVLPRDLVGYTQCHFFAGIGVWSFALRNAGWPDDRPIWTGSCPCQPFSTSGSQKGIDDERHLLPTFLELIRERRPGIVVGEQVASHKVIGKARAVHAGKDSTDWIDLIQVGLEDSHYEFGAVVTPSAGVGAPHIRQRAWWLGIDERMGDASGQGLAGCGRLEQEPDSERWNRAKGHDPEAGMVDGMGYSYCDRSVSRGEAATISRQGYSANSTSTTAGRVSQTDSFWSNADWIWCRDEKWRPVESGVEPLVDGTAERMVHCSDQGAEINPQKTSEARTMRLSGYGNAINAESARVFIECVMEVAA